MRIDNIAIGILGIIALICVGIMDRAYYEIKHPPVYKQSGYIVEHTWKGFRVYKR